MARPMPITSLGGVSGLSLVRRAARRPPSGAEIPLSSRHVLRTSPGTCLTHSHDRPCSARVRLFGGWAWKSNANTTPLCGRLVPHASQQGRRNRDSLVVDPSQCSSVWARGHRGTPAAFQKICHVLTPRHECWLNFSVSDLLEAEHACAAAVASACRSRGALMATRSSALLAITCRWTPQGPTSSTP
jgi:hypothetical protein